MSWLSTLQRKHALLLAVAFAATIPYGCHAAWSLGVGGGIQVVNLGALSLGARLIARAAGTGAGTAGQLVILFRFLLLVGLVLWVMTRTGVEPLPFGVGLLLALPAAAWQGLEEARRTE